MEFSSLINDFDRASSFRAETLAYIEAGLSPARHGELDGISSNPLITSFRPIGEAISKCCNRRRYSPGLVPLSLIQRYYLPILACFPGQVETFRNELRFFITMTEEEQAFQMTQDLPTVEEYTWRRMGFSAVGVCLATIECVKPATSLSFREREVNASQIRLRPRDT